MLFRSIEKIEKANGPMGITIMPNCGVSRFTTSWTVKYHNFDGFDTPLVSQIREFGIESVDVEFIFGTKFPFSPPFIRIISPRFSYHQADLRDNPELGFLDFGGGICTSMFKTGYWTPGYALINTIIDVKILLLTTNGLMLDPTNWNKPYSSSEALTKIGRAHV